MQSNSFKIEGPQNQELILILWSSLLCLFGISDIHLYLVECPEYSLFFKAEYSGFAFPPETALVQIVSL